MWGMLLHMFTCVRHVMLVICSGRGRMCAAAAVLAAAPWFAPRCCFVERLEVSNRNPMAPSCRWVDLDKNSALVYNSAEWDEVRGAAAPLPCLPAAGQ